MGTSLVGLPRTVGDNEGQPQWQLPAYRMRGTKGLQMADTAPVVGWGGAGGAQNVSAPHVTLLTW